MRALTSDDRTALVYKLCNMAWCDVTDVHDRANLLHYLLQSEHEFFVLVTDTWTIQTGQTVQNTVQTIVSAVASGYISSPLRLAYRPGHSDLEFRTDLALLIWSKNMNNILGDDLPGIASLLFPLDSKVAVIAARKRTGCLNAEGLYKSSFRTQKLNAELLRFYLSFLTGRKYLSL